MRTALWTVVAALGAAVLALVLVEIVHRVVGRLGRRSFLLAELARTAHRPFQVASTLYAVRIVVRARTEAFPGREALLHLLLLLVIAAVAWLVAALLLVFEDVALAKFRTDVPDNMRARRLHTQVVMLRRVTVAAIAVLAFGVMLMTFPSVRAVGAGLLTSAGVIGVVVALAAQTMLGNVFAGIQLAFSDAVRVDDVVVVDGEWGRIEELTLSYVVLQIWDDRRLILPSSYFTAKPFENWTRSQAAVLGTVEVDLDWAVPVPRMREELRRFVEGTELWDGRVCVLQVTEAVRGLVRVRALVSAADAPALWDLRCEVREHLVAWVRDRPATLPRVRTEVTDGADGSDGADGAGRAGPGRVAIGIAEGRADAGSGPGRAAEATGRGVGRPAWAAAAAGVGHGGALGDAGGQARVFGGSDDGEARGEKFVGPEERAEARP